jgi:hypothetical protein
MVSNDISLLSLYNTLEDIKKTYGQKINYLSSVYDIRSQLPDGVSNDNDGPGLWPDAGTSVYAIVPEHVLAQSFCSKGLLVNLASKAVRFQLMMVEHNDLYPERDGRLYARHALTPVDAWSSWRLILSIDDMRDILSGVTSVGHAKEADKLATPRKISLAGGLSGEALFDGSEDVTIDVDSHFVPLNVRHEANHYDGTRYLHLMSLKGSAGDTHAHAVVVGHVGGWKVDQGQATIHLDLSNRDGHKVDGLILGTLGNVDVVAVDDPTTDELHLFLELTEYVGGFKLSIYGDQVTVIDKFVTTPVYTPFWRMSRDGVYITGKDTNLKPNVVVGEAEVADKVKPVLRATGMHYLAGVDSAGNVLYSPDMLIDYDEAAVTVPVFIGDLRGSATRADTATITENIAARNVNTVKAQVLGLNGTTPIFDSQVYLEALAGVLHASIFTGGSVEVSAVKATTGTFSGQVTVGNLQSSTTVTGKSATFNTTVTATTFIGDLNGNATTATTADSANKINVVSNNKIKALVIGHANKVPYADSGVYLTTNEGELQVNNLLGATAKFTGNVNAAKFIGAFDGNASTATLASKATTVAVTTSSNTKASLVGHVGDNLYADDDVYIATTSGGLHAKVIDGTTASFTNSVTAPNFNGALNGNATSADLATTANNLTSTSASNVVANVIGVVGNKPYIDPDIYTTSSAGELHAKSFSGTSATFGSSVTAPTFNGALNGNATTSTTASIANKVNVTNNNGVTAYLVGHASNVPYYDSGVYLTTTAGQLHVTTLDASSLVYAPAAQLKASTPYIDFHYGSASSYTTRLSATSASMLNCSTQFTATKVYNAVWNDYAEFFPRGGETEPGDVIALDVTQGKEAYTKAHDGCTCVVGVHSDEYGHIIGGEQPPVGVDFHEYNIVRYIPVALAGRVRVNFIGPAKRGQRVVPANDGKARLFRDGDDPATVIGMLVEDDVRTDARRLRVKLW